MRHELRDAAVAAGILPLDGLDFTLAGYASELESRLTKVELRHFRYVPTWRVLAMPIGIVSITMTLTVPDRNTGAPTLVQDGDCFVPCAFEPEDVVRYVRERVRSFVLHEVDEALRLGDGRPFDPHVGEARA